MNGLQVIRVSADRVVLKRGVRELLIEGSSAESLVEPLLRMLDGKQTREQIINAFPGPLRSDVETLLTALSQRLLITPDLEPILDELDPTVDALQSAFYRNFGAAIALNAQDKLQKAKVLIFGSTLIAQSLVRGLLEMNLGGVTVVEDPILSNHITAIHWKGEGLNQRKAAVGDSDEKLRVLSGNPSVQDLEEVSLVCATSDLGEPEALLDVNRTALKIGKPFLPAWLDDMVGYVGPLNYPFETACLRCYRLRVDSNDAKFEISRAIRRHITSDPESRQATGLLPPMASVVGNIAAMEIAKSLGQFVPSDSVGRMIEVNLVSFKSVVRRVLKIPRCPDCSDVMKQRAIALTRGPQIVYHD